MAGILKRTEWGVIGTGKSAKAVPLREFQEHIPSQSESFNSVFGILLKAGIVAAIIYLVAGTAALQIIKQNPTLFFIVVGAVIAIFMFNALRRR